MDNRESFKNFCAENFASGKLLQENRKELIFSRR